MAKELRHRFPLFYGLTSLALLGGMVFFCVLSLGLGALTARAWLVRQAAVQDDRPSDGLEGGEPRGLPTPLERFSLRGAALAFLPPWVERETLIGESDHFSFVTDKSPAEVIAFYKEAFEEQGWEREDQVGEATESSAVRLVFVQGEQRAVVWVIPLPVVGTLVEVVFEARE